MWSLGQGVLGKHTRQGRRKEPGEDEYVFCKKNETGDSYPGINVGLV